MTEFLKSSPHRNCFLAIDVGRANFCLGRRPHHILHDVGNGKEGTIQGWRLDGRLIGGSGETAEEVVTSGTAACFGFQKETGVAVNV